MSTSSTRIVAFLFGVLPGSFMAYLAVSLIRAGTQDGVVLAAAGLAGYVALWALAFGPRPAHIVTRLGLVSGVIAGIVGIAFGASWWWRALCAGPIIIGFMGALSPVRSARQKE